MNNLIVQDLQNFMPQVKPEIETFAKITVLGVGGGGSAAVNRMINSRLKGVDFITINTDAQALHHSNAGKKLNIGKSVTRGLGAGMDPDVGKKAAEESQNEIRDALKDKDMVFITCGLGGGTGSGASPIVAEIAKESGALTIAVVTKPFSFEGTQRKENAEKAHRELAEKVDAIITIPNDRVLQITDRKATLLDAFKLVDDVLLQGVQGISEVISIPGLINVDFADVKAIMKDTGSALMGIGKASGENRAAEAAKFAISSPLLDLSIDGARGILFTISGGESLGMHEVSEAAKIITGNADENAKIIFGAVVDKELKDEIKITVIAAGFEKSAAVRMRDRDDAQEKQFFASGKSGGMSFGQSRPKITPSGVQESKQDSFKKPHSAPQPVYQDEDEENLEIPAFIRRKMGQ